MLEYLSTPSAATIACISNSTLLLKEGKVYNYGQALDKDRVNYYTPALLSNVPSATDIVAGDSHVFLITSRGEVYKGGRTNDVDEEEVHPFSLLFNKASAISVTVPGTYEMGTLKDAFIVTKEGKLYRSTWDIFTLVPMHEKILTAGVDMDGNIFTLTACSNVYKNGKEFMTGVRDMSVEEEHCLFLTFDGLVYGYGRNGSGELGLGKEVEECNVPTLLPLPFSVSLIKVSFSGSFVVSEEGNLYSCGLDEHGELGLGIENADVSTLVFTFRLVSLPTIVTEIAVGLNHTVVKGEDGLYYSTGRNDHGQLGHGNTCDTCDTTASCRFEQMLLS